jgi:hypothetical protein
VEVGDSHGAKIIQNSCVGCLARLAVLCEFIGRKEPNSKPQMDEICDWSLEQFGNLTQGICLDEYTYLELLLKVRRLIDCSWQKKLLLALRRLDFMGKLSGRIRLADRSPYAR